MTVIRTAETLPHEHAGLPKVVQVSEDPVPLTRVFAGTSQKWCTAIHVGKHS